jgi:signal transduction histidine kinase
MHDPPPRPALLQSALADRVLLGALAASALLIGYQLSVTLLQPPWIKPATDWLRAALAWPQLLIVAWVALRLLRTHQPGALAWCWVAVGMLSYTVGRTTWTIADFIIYPQGVPFPSLPDLFFILQYPFFVAALFLIPTPGRWLPGLRTMLDALIWMSVVTALTWYFVLLPMSLQTHEALQSKSISMYYQVADLLLFYGLVAALSRPRHTTCDLAVIVLLSLAVLCLFVADTWAALLLLHPPHTYATGGAPDLFWFTSYLLVPLAALVRLRLTPADLPPRPPISPARLTWQDVLAGLLFIFPSIAAIAASVLIIIHATVISRGTASLIVPEAVSIALLLLATLRPAVLFLEQEQLRRERDAAREQERGLRLANQRMEAFLTVLAHELKTPLTVLIGNIELMANRLEALLRPDAQREDYTRGATVLRTLVEYCQHNLQRMEQLVEDVLDETRIRRGRLALRLQPCDLIAVVGAAVAEQAALNPERVILLVADAPTAPVPVTADASRITQVVTNLVSNALKFSRADQAVEVRVQVQVEAQARAKGGQARVAVHDEGVGIPEAEQAHIWEQFYQVESAAVQSGSQVGVGMGLYISRAIVEGHHGRVGVESVRGQGTTIWFTLPLSAPLASSLSSQLSPPAPASVDDIDDRPAAEAMPSDHEQASSC